MDFYLSTCQHTSTKDIYAIAGQSAGGRHMHLLTSKPLVKNSASLSTISLSKLRDFLQTLFLAKSTVLIIMVIMVIIGVAFWEAGITRLHQQCCSCPGRDFALLPSNKNLKREVDLFIKNICLLDKMWHIQRYIKIPQIITLDTHLPLASPSLPTGHPSSNHSDEVKKYIFFDFRHKSFSSTVNVAHSWYVLIYVN